MPQRFLQQPALCVVGRGAEAMAMNNEWEEITEALRRWESLASFRPTIVAMTRAAERLRANLAAVDLHPRVSHMWLSLRRDGRARGVDVGWKEASPVCPDEPTGYVVCFSLPSMEVTDRKIVAEAELVDVVREYLARL
jgi:hypothetical protein